MAGQAQVPRVVPIICENGNPMHECDVVLATYEQLRKELQNNDK